MLKFFNSATLFIIGAIVLSGCHLLSDDSKRVVSESNGWFDYQVSFLDTVKSTDTLLCNKEIRVFNHYENWCLCTDENQDDSTLVNDLWFIQSRYESLLSNGYQKKTANELMKLQGWSLKLPGDFKVIKQKKGFVWIRNTMKKHDVHIWGYKSKYTSKDQFLTSEISSKRDSILKEHFHFRKYDTTSYASTEDYFDIDNKQVYWKGSYAQKVSGAWKINREKQLGKTMGGPFLGFAIVSESNPKYFFYIEAFFSAPNQDKLPFIRTLEAILSTFECQKNERRF